MHNGRISLAPGAFGRRLHEHFLGEFFLRGMTVLNLVREGVTIMCNCFTTKCWDRSSLMWATSMWKEALCGKTFPRKTEVNVDQEEVLKEVRDDELQKQRVKGSSWWWTPEAANCTVYVLKTIGGRRNDGSVWGSEQQKENRRLQSFFFWYATTYEVKEGKKSLKEKEVAGWSIEVSVNIQVEE